MANDKTTMPPRTVRSDVDVLGRCLGTVHKEQEGEAFFALEERVRLETIRLREAGEDTAPMQAVLRGGDIWSQVKWARTFRGGKVQDPRWEEDAPACASSYGLCG